MDDPGSKTVKQNDPEDGVKRDRFGRYMLPDPNGGERDVPWTRATTFAKSISDTYSLSMWQQRMAVLGVAQRKDLLMSAKTLHPLRDKDALNGIVEQAKEQAEAKSAARLGSALHALTEHYDATGQRDHSAEDDYVDHVDAYAQLLEDYTITTRPSWIERITVWRKYGIAGTLDRIVLFQGQPTILDLKTGRDLTYGWNEIAIQLCVYAHGAGLWNPRSLEWEAMPEGLRKDWALVIHLPAQVPEGERPTATMYKVDLRPALAAAQLCYDVREWRKTRNLATPVKPPPAEPSTDWPARIAAASSEGELKTMFMQIPSVDDMIKSAFRQRARELRELAG